MAETALAMTADDAPSRAAMWRQLVDIVAQARGSFDAAVSARLFGRIAELRDAVAPAQRRAAAFALSARADHPGIVALFADDSPVIAAPVIASARLADPDWLELLPKLPPASRALLRHRRDLAPSVERALASYGASDFALPGGAPEADGNQIRELVARIEAFRRQPPAPPPAPADAFAFECGTDGVIDWVDGIGREAIIGIDIGETFGDGLGVDGQAAGAFRRRAPFSDARLTVGGDGPASGGWRISAGPRFDPATGRFAGYRGDARRPRPDEEAPHAAAPPPSPESMRQLIHELRTPLNAITGFAEMIEHQLLGPVAAAYRDGAGAISTDARLLVELVDDLDQAARAFRSTAEAEIADLGDIAERQAHRFAATLAMRDAGFTLNRADGPVIAAVVATFLERMIARLFGSMFGLARSGETIAVSVSRRNDRARIDVARPAALTGFDEAALLDPGLDAPLGIGEAPLLGFGFTLRLIANLARDAGGRLEITADGFAISLPAARLSAFAVDPPAR